MAPSPYQMKLKSMLTDERIFTGPLRKALEDNIKFSYKSTSHILRAEVSITQAAKIIVSADYEMSASDKLTMWSLLGSYSTNYDLAYLGEVLEINLSYVVLTLRRIIAGLNDNEYDDNDLKLAAAALIEAGKEIKAFSDSLTH